MKFESLTKRKIAELQNFISNYDTSGTQQSTTESFDKAVAALRLENKIQKETIEALKVKVEEMAVEAQRVSLANSQSAERKFTETQLKLDQKTAQIAELVESKRQLSLQLEELTNKYLQLDQSAFAKLESMRQRCQEDMRKAKTDWEAQSQVRFKDWKEKTKRQLKESTIKGLEPEINKIIKKGEFEKEKLKSHYEELMRNREEEVERTISEKVQSERERLVAENKALFERQKAILEEGFQKETLLLKRSHELEVAANSQAFERERKAFEALKLAELTSLKERLNKCQNELREAKESFEAKLRAVQREAELTVSERIASAQRDHLNSQIDLKAKLESQAEETCREQLKKNTEELNGRHREEIAMLINRFAEEAANGECRKCQLKGSQSDSERTEFLKSKLKESDQERAYLRQKQSILAEKIESYKEEKLRLENDVLRLREEVGVLVVERESLKGRLRAVEGELESCRNCSEERLKEVRRLRSEAIEMRSQSESVKLSSEQSLRSYYEGELESQQRKFDAELDGLQRRISEAMEAKERTIGELRGELELKQSLIAKYEEVLEQQKRDFMGFK